MLETCPKKVLGQPSERGVGVFFKSAVGSMVSLPPGLGLRQPRAPGLGLRKSTASSANRQLNQRKSPPTKNHAAPAVAEEEQKLAIDNGVANAMAKLDAVLNELIEVPLTKRSYEAFLGARAFLQIAAEGKAAVAHVGGEEQMVESAMISSAEASTSDAGPPKTPTMQGTKLWVGNLSPSVTKADLVLACCTYGEVVNIFLLPRKSGRSRVAAFVSFNTPDEASAALQGLSGMPLNGDDPEPLVARIAAQSKETGPKSTEPKASGPPKRMRQQRRRNMANGRRSSSRDGTVQFSQAALAASARASSTTHETPSRADLLSASTPPTGIVDTVTNDGSEWRKDSWGTRADYSPESGCNLSGLPVLPWTVIGETDDGKDACKRHNDHAVLMSTEHSQHEKFTIGAAGFNVTSRPETYARLGGVQRSDWRQRRRVC